MEHKPTGLQMSAYYWLFWGQVVLGGVLLAALGYFFWPTLAPLGGRLANDDNYSSALLLPLVIAYIVYRKRAELGRQSWQPSWWGLAVMALGLGSYLAGELVAIPYVGRVSVVLVLGGVLFLLGGWQVVKTLSFPLFLLVIMVPLPQFFISRMTLRMQLASSQLAAEMLRLMGYAVNLQGNVLDLGTRKLQIVAACSGLGYLFNALGLAVIFCYFFQRRLWKVLVLLAAMFPFAIVANASRLASIGVFPSLEKGFWHVAFGLSIFVVGFDYLKMVNWGLNRLSSPPEAVAAPGPAAAAVTAVPRTSHYPYLAAGLVLTVLAGPVAFRAVEVRPVPLLQSFDRFPMQLGPWEGRQVPVEPEIVAATGADAVLNADFVNHQHGQVSLWIAYYANQKSGESVHSPITCITGSGWQTEKADIFELAPGKPINYILFNQGGRRLAVYYWYYERGRWLASDYWHKLSIGWDRLTSRRADGALVRLTTPVQGDEAKARARLDGFLGQLSPTLPEFIRDDRNVHDLGGRP